jgi:hypothetical protein
MKNASFGGKKDYPIETKFFELVADYGILSSGYYPSV